MNKFSIRDLENLTGIKAHTLRIWEQRYGILQPKRTLTNIRFYDAADLKLALKVALLNSYGYKISRIHKMSETEMSTLIQKVADKDFKLQALVNDLLDATFAFDIDMFEHLLDKYIRRNSVEQAVEQLIFLFLEKIGLMWMTERIFPAQEHLISNVIYRKISVAIEQLPTIDESAGPEILLFLPEGEIHDLGLLYVYYLLRKYGKKPIYLGPNSPIREVQHVVEARRPTYIYVHLTSVTEEFDGNKYLQRMAELLPCRKIFVSGSMLRSRKYHEHEKIRFLYNLQEVKQALVEL